MCDDAGEGEVGASGRRGVTIKKRRRVRHTTQKKKLLLKRTTTGAKKEHQAKGEDLESGEARRGVMAGGVECCVWGCLCLSGTRAWPGSPCAHSPGHTGPASPPLPHTALQTHAYSLQHNTHGKTGTNTHRGCEDRHIDTIIHTHDAFKDSHTLCHVRKLIVHKIKSRRQLLCHAMTMMNSRVAYDRCSTITTRPLAASCSEQSS